MNTKIILILFIGFIFFVNHFSLTGQVPQVTSEGRWCNDFDSGFSPYEPGYVESDIGTFYDRCFDNLRQIREYYCTEGRFGGNYQVESRVMSCGIGYECRRDIYGKADACQRSV